MTFIPVQPFIMKDVALKIAADNYEAHCSTVELVPSSSIVNWKGLTPASTFSFPTTSTWVCNMGYAQDWTTDDSLSAYLHEHEGESVDVVFTPDAGGPSVETTIFIAPGSIGGAVDGVAVGSVSLGVQGKPAFVPVP